MHVVERIEALRRERGISVAKLARSIGVDRKRLWYVLNGQREMRVDEFLKLCVALRVDPRSFVTHKRARPLREKWQEQYMRRTICPPRLPR